MDEILTLKTDCHTAFQQWFPRLETLERELKLSDEALMFDLDTPEYAHPVILAFVHSRDSETGLPCLAERMTFEKLGSFLYVDSHKVMAPGNLPRHCAYCGQ